MAISPNTDFTAGAILTAAQQNRFPRGILNYSNAVTANFTTSGTHTTFQDVTNLTASVTYAANRVIRVTLEVGPYVPGGANGVEYKAIRGSTDLKIWTIPSEALSGSVDHDMSLTVTFAGPGTGATETFKVQMRGVSNTQVGNQAGATSPSRLIIEDLGPS